MYKAIQQFRDLTDGHLYQEGETFPHDGREIPADRLDALVSDNNRAGKALIVWASEEKPVEETAPQKPAAEKPRKTRKTTKE